jgi:hypothetical protein
MVYSFNLFLTSTVTKIGSHESPLQLELSQLGKTSLSTITQLDLQDGHRQY